MAKIFKPRRGKASTMAGTKASTVLASGEMFIEVPDTGVGKGHSKMKVGDGSTVYSSLPYAMGDTANDTIAFSSNTSTTVATALNAVVSGGALKNLIAGLKQAITLCNTAITQLNDDITDINTSLENFKNDLSSRQFNYYSSSAASYRINRAEISDLITIAVDNYGGSATSYRHFMVIGDTVAVLSGDYTGINCSISNGVILLNTVSYCYIAIVSTNTIDVIKV